jgi:hypothetical protein
MPTVKDEWITDNVRRAAKYVYPGGVMRDSGGGGSIGLEFGLDFLYRVAEHVHVTFKLTSESKSGHGYYRIEGIEVYLRGGTCDHGHYHPKVLYFQTSYGNKKAESLLHAAFLAIDAIVASNPEEFP